jgi:hypothetical protein
VPVAYTNAANGVRENCLRNSGARWYAVCMRPSPHPLTSLVLLCTASAGGQCTPGWLPGQGLPGVNGGVYSSTTWDPDGTGPLRERFIVGGVFTFAGDVPAARVAAWDGAGWTAMSLPQVSIVHSLSQWDGTLLAGTNAGVWRWDGAAWHSLGSTMLGRVDVLAEFDGQLYAGGTFNSISTTCRMARWDGAAWQAVPGGPASPGAPASEFLVASMVVDGNSLVVGGRFSQVGAAQQAYSIARYDGANWSSVGPPASITGEVRDLTLYNGQLHAGGIFSVAGAPASQRDVARFDGTSWAAVPGVTSGFVEALAVHQGELFIGGFGLSAQGMCIARWDGAVLTPIGHSGSIVAIESCDGHLLVGGGFSVLDGGMRNVGRWEGGSSWSPLGSGFSGEVLALEEFQGDVIAAGSFRRAGGVPTGQVARRTAAGWQPMGGTFNADVRSLKAVGNTLYAAGGISTYNGAPVTSVVRWDGVGWVSVGNTGAVGPVYCLGSHDGQMYMGGAFTFVDGQPMLRIARWSGASWFAVGTGIGFPTASEAVYGLSDFGGELVALGRFTLPSGAQSIARWDGATWQSFGTGIGFGANAGVYTAAVYEGSLYAGGIFTLSSPSVWSSLARWTGTQWVEVGGASNGAVFALLAHEGRLLAGGIFSSIAGVPAARIAAWDGVTWSPLDSGLQIGTNVDVQAMLSRPGELLVGGDFMMAGPEASPYLAAYGCTPCYPNCDRSTVQPVLNVGDFTCFLQRFAAGEAYANCDLSTTSPVLNVGDFTCFLQRFAAGCP